MVRKKIVRKAPNLSGKQLYDLLDYPVGYWGEGFAQKAKNLLVKPAPAPAPAPTRTPSLRPRTSESPRESPRNRRDQPRRGSRRSFRPQPQLPEGRKDEITPRQTDTQLVPADDARKAAIEDAAKKRGYPPVRPDYRRNPPATQSREKGLAQQWEEAIENAKKTAIRKASEAVTPAGLARGARSVGRAALKARDEIEERIVAHNAIKAEEAQIERQRRIDNWNNLTDEQRQTILETRAQQARLKEELRQKRTSYDQYNADRLMASLSGSKFFPKVYKVPGGSGMFGETSDDKYVDEYGREVPGIPEELYKRRQRHTEQSDIDAVLGGGGGRRRSRRRDYGDTETNEPRPRRRTETEMVMSENAMIKDLFR